MSLLDASLVLLFAVPVCFFMGIAAMYCRHARELTLKLRQDNKRLQSMCMSLKRENVNLHEAVDKIDNKNPKDMLELF